MDLIQVGKAVFGKEITLPWESNPGPSPIRGGPVTILAFIVCLFLAEDPFKSSNISFDKIEPSKQRLGCKNWGTPGIEQRWIWEKTGQCRRGFVGKCSSSRPRKEKRVQKEFAQSLCMLFRTRQCTRCTEWCTRQCTWRRTLQCILYSISLPVIPRIHVALFHPVFCITTSDQALPVVAAYIHS